MKTLIRVVIILSEHKNMNESKKHLIKPIEFLILISIILLLIGILIPDFKKEFEISPQLICGTNMSGLGKGLLVYFDEHDKYPSANKWCDALLHDGNTMDNDFKCPANKKVKCSYQSIRIAI